MIPKNLLINRPASKEILKIAEKQFKGKEQPLFAVVGDLELDSCYGEGAIYVTENRILAIGNGFEGGFFKAGYLRLRNPDFFGYFRLRFAFIVPQK